MPPRIGAYRLESPLGARDRRGSRRRPRSRTDPPRPQGREHRRHPLRPRQDSRLRAGPPRLLGRRDADPAKRSHRHLLRHVARAGERRRARRPVGPLLLWSAPVRDAHRPVGIPRQKPARDPGEGAPRSAAAARGGAPGSSGRSRRARRAAPRQGPRRPAEERGPSGAKAGRDRARAAGRGAARTQRRQRERDADPGVSGAPFQALRHGRPTVRLRGDRPCAPRAELDSGSRRSAGGAGDRRGGLLHPGPAPYGTRPAPRYAG